MCLIVPAIVLERPGIGAALGRGQALVRGYGWAVYGTVVGLVLGLISAPCRTRLGN